MSNAFGPSRTQWSDGDSVGKQTVKTIVLVDVGQDRFTDLELMHVGEYYAEGVIAFENVGGERLGSLTNIHYSEDRKALIGNLTTNATYTESQLFLQFSEDRRRIERLVLSK